MSSKPNLKVSQSDGVLQLTIDSPEKRNSIHAPGVVEGLIAGIDTLDHEPDLGVAIVTGAGGVFSSGGDLTALQDKISPADIRQHMARSAELYRRIARSEKLVIAAVDGAAFGAGLGLAAACDIVVAGASAKFCCAFVRVGAMPDAFLFWSLPLRVGVARARQLMLTGKVVNASEALAMNLADECNADGDALPLAQSLAAQFASGPRRAYGRIKAGLRRAPMSLEQAFDFQYENAPELFVSEDFKEGATAFLEKRAPKFTGR